MNQRPAALPIQMIVIAGIGALMLALGIIGFVTDPAPIEGLNDPLICGALIGLGAGADLIGTFGIIRWAKARAAQSAVDP